MKRMEITAEWIASELDAVFRSYSRDEVDRALPLILLMMGSEIGMENLEPKIKGEVIRVLGYAGVRDEMSVEERQEKIAAFIGTLNVSESLIRDLKSVFDVHAEARTEESASRFGKMLPFRRVRSAPKVGEQRPADTIGGGEMLRRATGMIRS